jgi:hypothetical protein
MHALGAVLQLVKQDGGGPHRSPPKDELLDVEMVAQEHQHRLDIVLLQMPQCDIFTLRVARSLEIEAAEVDPNLGSKPSVLYGLHQASVETMAVHNGLITYAFQMGFRNLSACLQCS